MLSTSGSGTTHRLLRIHPLTPRIVVAYVRSTARNRNRSVASPTNDPRGAAGLALFAALIAFAIVGIRKQHSRRVRRTSVGVVAALALAIVVVVVGRVGCLFPAKLDLVNSELAADSSTRTVTKTYIVQNNGWFSEQIRGLDASVPGIEVLRTIGHDRDLPRGQIVNLVVVYHVTDCANPPTSPIPINVHIHHAWGHGDHNAPR